MIPLPFPGTGVPLPSTVISAVKSFIEPIAAFLARLVGARPRGDLQKFHRTIYPVMRAASSVANMSVYAGWFGDLIEVNPAGEVKVRARYSSLDQVDGLMKDLVKTYGSAKLLICQSEVGNFEDPTLIAQYCKTIDYAGGFLGWLGGLGGGGGELPGPVDAGLGSGGSSSLVWVPVVLLVLWLLTRKGR